MRRKALAIGTGVLLAAAIAAPASSATQLCAGSDKTLMVCTVPNGGTLYEDCVYVGTPPCQTVTVPGPTVECSSPRTMTCEF